MSMQRVINFSGGKTSAYMTITEYQPGDIVLFCDTGREHPKTYKFLNDFEAFEGIPIHRVRYALTKEGKAIAAAVGLHYEGMSAFSLMLLKKKYQVLPRRIRRFCTVVLKIKTARRYLVSLGHKKYIQMIGFRSDEPVRVKRHVERIKSVKTTFPLYTKGIDKQYINDYWKQKPYTLEIPSILGNCDLCFVKGKNAVMAILREYPGFADKWIEDEKKVAEITGRNDISFIEGITIEQLRNLAQNNLFSNFPLEEISPAFDCACTT